MIRPLIAIHIRQSNSRLNENDVLLDESLIQKLKIPTQQHITLRFGSSLTMIKVIRDSRTKSLSLSESLARKLSLHNGASLRISYNAAAQTLSIGPVIAVVMSKYSGKHSTPFASNTGFCMELTEASKIQGAFVYFLTPSQIDTSKPVQEGWSYYGGWKKMSFPYPDIVHNRLGSRKAERSPLFQNYIKYLKSTFNTQIFNEKFLNKSEVFQALEKDHSLLKYLPESHLFKNYAMLKSMCGKYATVFLKPITGSLGKGIIKITRTSGSGYSCHFSSAAGTKKVIYPTLTKVFNTISGKMKVQRYQIQQGLNLITVSGRPLDFRALVQKNIDGEWKITSIVARIAGSQHFVSNLARGGTLSTVQEALLKSNLSSQKRKRTRLGLRKAALEIAQGIEKNVTAHFGELGIDLAVDTNGRIWLLEVNSKPSKSDDTSLNDQKIRPSVLKIIQYSRFLSGL